MATRRLDSTATFAQTMPADGLWTVLVFDGPYTNPAFGVAGIDSSGNATKLSQDLLARGYHSVTVAQQGA